MIKKLGYLIIVFTFVYVISIFVGVLYYMPKLESDMIEDEIKTIFIILAFAPIALILIFKFLLDFLVKKRTINVLSNYAKKHGSVFQKGIEPEDNEKMSKIFNFIFVRIDYFFKLGSEKIFAGRKENLKNKKALNADFYIFTIMEKAFEMPDTFLVRKTSSAGSPSYQDLSFFERLILRQMGKGKAKDNYKYTSNAEIERVKNIINLIKPRNNMLIRAKDNLLFIGIKIGWKNYFEEKEIDDLLKITQEIKKI